MASAKPMWIPHEYQIEGIRRALTQAALGLFLDPGLGKTSIALSAFKLLKEKGYAKKMLVIAPLRPCYGVWPAEIEKWENFQDLSYAILHGPAKEQTLRLEADIYIINPEGVPWLYDQSSDRHNVHQFDILCIDESTKFKKPTTERFKALQRGLPNFKYRWLLTGTPAPNGLMDLFGQMLILDGGRALGKYKTHFLREFYYRGYNLYEWNLQPGAPERITERIKPLIYQLSAEDYLQMPELIFVNIEVTLPEKAMEVYRAVENEFIALIDSGVLVADNAAVAGVKCRQIANGAVYTEDTYHVVHDAKLDALEDLLDELAGKPCLVLYEFRHDFDRIRKRLPAATSIGSDTPERDLQGIIRRFNAGEISTLLGHPGSMGHGLNLQGTCHHVIWFGIPWNLEHYDQAIARVYRQGQKAEHVIVYHLVCTGTVDERVIGVLEQKDHDQQQLLSSLGNRLVV